MGFVRVFSASLIVSLACARITLAAGDFEDSIHLAAIPPAPPCDLVITPANATTALTQHNDLDKRVICVRPGDYRFIGKRDLRVSGTATAKRYFRYDGPEADKHPVHRSSQAIFESIRIFGSNWIVQGITVRPTDPVTTYFLPIFAGDDNVVDGNLLDGRDHQNGTQQLGVMVRGLEGDPAVRNTIQRNVIRNGDQSHNAIDYSGVNVMFGWQTGENNNWNKVLDNEIYDWGDGVAVSGISDLCDEAGQQHGTVIDGNDVYITGAKRVNCETGAAQANGACACAENGIDVKAHPSSSSAAYWTRVTNNRVWGYRPTTEAIVCGGSGSNGQAITAGSFCPRNVFVANNTVADSTIGIEAAGFDWVVAGNLVHDIRAFNGNVYSSIALLTMGATRGVIAQFNTIVRADTAYDDGSANTDMRCNVVVDAPGLLGIGRPRGANHTTAYNALYHSQEVNIAGGTNASWSTVVPSNNDDYCYWRKRFTAPERVCVPAAATTPRSPHVAHESQCNEAIGAPYGVPRITFRSRQAACGLGTELAVLLPALDLLRRRRSSRRSGSDPVRELQ